MKYWGVAGLIFGSLIVQVSALDKAVIHGVKPDLLLLLAVALGILYGPRTGAAVGFAAGILQDLLLGQYIGLHAFSKALTGAVAGLVEREVFKENLILPIFAGFIGTVVNEVTIFALLHLFGRRMELGYSWRTIILPVAVYNTVLHPFLYGLLFRLASSWRAQAAARAEGRKGP